MQIFFGVSPCFLSLPLSAYTIWGIFLFLIFTLNLLLEYWPHSRQGTHHFLYSLGNTCSHHKSPDSKKPDTFTLSPTHRFKVAFIPCFHFCGSSIYSLCRIEMTIATPLCKSAVRLSLWVIASHLRNIFPHLQSQRFPIRPDHQDREGWGTPGFFGGGNKCGHIISTSARSRIEVMLLAHPDLTSLERNQWNDQMTFSISFHRIWIWLLFEKCCRPLEGKHLIHSKTG